MPLAKVVRLDALPPGTMTEARVNGQSYVVANAGGEIHALGGVCPHRGASLAHGALHGSSIVCPWHAWEFDCRSGEHDFDPSIRLARVPVRLADGDIYIEVP
ncbi:MAG: Rieske (2Fe-2S) protein [Acidobacteria bacterium]|nr:Rieske (2Fe-2S) protein [Acidobacteriota bacterium]